MSKVLQVLNKQDVYSTEDSVFHALQLTNGNMSELVHLDNFSEHGSGVLHYHGYLFDKDILKDHKVLWSVYSDKECKQALNLHPENTICHSLVLSRKYGIPRAPPCVITEKRSYCGTVVMIEHQNPLAACRLALSTVRFFLSMNMSMILMVPFDRVDEMNQLVIKEKMPPEILKIAPIVPLINLVAKKSACVITSGIKVLACLASKVPVLIPNYSTGKVAPVIPNSWELLYNSDFNPPNISTSEMRTLGDAVTEISSMYIADAIMRKNRKNPDANILSLIEQAGLSYKKCMTTAMNYSKIFDHVINNFGYNKCIEKYKTIYSAIESGKQATSCFEM